MAELWMLDAEARRRCALMAIEVITPHNVFIDESVQNRYGQEFIGVSAYIATFESWIGIEKLWNTVLEDFRVPILPNTEFPFFHMTDFIARKSSLQTTGVTQSATISLVS
jgi:hypothetical protein